MDYFYEMSKTKSLLTKLNPHGTKAPFLKCKLGTQYRVLKTLWKVVQELQSWDGQNMVIAALLVYTVVDGRSVSCNVGYCFSSSWIVHLKSRADKILLILVFHCHQSCWSSSENNLTLHTVANCNLFTYDFTAQCITLF